MGAAEFSNIGEGRDLTEAFETTRDEALFLYGHGGYSGSIGEKGTVVLIDPDPMTYRQAKRRMHRLMALKDSPDGFGLVPECPGFWHDKWDAAAALEIRYDTIPKGSFLRANHRRGNRCFLFFGTASE